MSIFVSRICLRATATPLVLALVLAGTTTMTQAGQIYRWVDGQGRVHFGDQPPPGAELMRAGSPDTGLDTTATDPDPATSDADHDGGITRGPCMEAMEELAEYRTADVINQRDALGNERTLDDDERNQVLDHMAAEVEAICAGD